MRHALILLLVLFMPLQALAHAQLRGAGPADGAVLDAMPGNVTLTFNEPVAPLVLRLFGPDGAATDLVGTAENAVVTAALRGVLVEGTYLLSWRVVSADGHPVGGTLTFHIGAPSAAPPTPADLAAGAARMASALRFLLTATVVVAVGASLFAAFVIRGQAGPQLSRAALVAASATLPAGVLVVGVQGLDMLSLAPAALLTPQPWWAGLSAPVTLTVILSCMAAVLSAGALRCGTGPVRDAFALVALLLAALSFAASGHAAAAPPRAVALPAVTLHAAALVFWMGSLLPLLFALRGADAAVILHRFAAIAIPAVVVLVLSGATLTWLQAGTSTGLMGSAYGIVLAAKLVLVAILLGVAARNRFVLTPALCEAQPQAAPHLRRAIRAEIVLGLAILALASGFRLTPPPRALAAPVAPLYAHIHTDRAMADIRLTPGRAGPVTVMLGFQTGDFAELVPRAAEVIFAQPAAGIAPIRQQALRGGDGLWHAGPVTLPLAGDWEVTLRLLITDFESMILTDTINLPD
ncbi:copper resistance CopC/CopD family protein [Yoonia vestfoldensis]|uniref:copper resistance CopC/CopD family protein n=1 Tax=Yoonia vestfoldensis TaxID=245188 RepID=UPI000362147B|nr:CopD family protein [Yoonia vestfoldensis]